MEWQQIETAPTDGSWVLLTGGKIDYGWDGDAKPACVVGQWNVSRNIFRGEWHFAWYDSGYYGEYEEPTHWMPLPTPPPQEDAE